MRLETTKSPGEAIVGFFREIVDRSLADPQHRGCMLVNATLGATADDPKLQAYLADETSKIEQFFLRCAIAGRKSGKSPKTFAPKIRLGNDWPCCSDCASSPGCVLMPSC